MYPQLSDHHATSASASTSLRTVPRKRKSFIYYSEFIASLSVVFKVIAVGKLLVIEK